MGIYAQDIEDILLGNIHNGKNYIKDNILHNYDNWTYHIQFYMIPQDSYRNYTRNTFYNNRDVESYIELNKFLNESKKIIIAESGATPGISIDSLNMITYPPTSKDSYGVTTTSLELNLSEIGSSSLMNKIALASYMCGYQSYTNQTYFLNIWFEGYEANTNGDVIKKKIPLYEDKNGNVLDVITYNCVMFCNSSVPENNITKYQLSLTPIYYNSRTKELTNVNNFGDIEIDRFEYFGEVIKKLEKTMNEILAIQYGKEVIENVYQNTKPIKIEYTKPFDYFNSEYKKAADAIINLKYNDIYNHLKNDIAKKNLKYIDKSYNPYNLVYGFDIVNIGKKLLATVTSAIRAFELKGTSIVLWFKNWLSSKIKISPDNYSSLPSYIGDIISGYFNPISMNGYMPVVIYKIQYIDDYNGKSYYAHKISIDIREVPGLNEMQDAIKDINASNYVNNIKEKQEKYLDILIENDILQKRYKWILNGENIDVLNLKRTENNLWYMNIGLSNINFVEKGTIKADNIPEKFIDDEDNKIIDKKNKLFSENNELIKKINKLGETIYIDDLYDFLEDDDKKNGISKYFGITLASSPYAEFKSVNSLNNATRNNGNPLSEKEKKELSISNIGVVTNKIGMQNIFQWGGQKMSLVLDIIGDPYWLFYSADEIEFSPFFGNENMKLLDLPHIIMCTKSFYSNDKKDDYKGDDLMDLNTLYMITKITSSLSEGKFTQKLEGFVATPFIQASAGDSQYFVTSNNKNISNNTNKGTTVVENKNTGNIQHLQKQGEYIDSLAENNNINISPPKDINEW